MTLSVSIQKNHEFGNCSECKESLIESSGYLVCPNCGLVSERVITQPFKIKSSLLQKQSLVLNGCKNNQQEHGKFNYGGGKKSYDAFYQYNEILQQICSDLLFTDQAVLRCLTIYKNYCEKDENRKKLTSKHYSSVFAFLSVYQTIAEYKLFISKNEIFTIFLDYQKTHISREVINKALISFKVTRRFTVEDYLKKYHSELLSNFPNLQPQTEKVFELAKMKRRFQGSNPETFATAILYLTYYDWKIRKPKGFVSQLKELTGKSWGCIANIRKLAFDILNKINEEGI